ncbi:CHAT domain-containing protein [Planktothrix paucivesiculata]|uniref:CHAT domain-containing protein n=1 Tax=Planktothrix paucivesiculata PCC 9631 TaxID=671071 RepID=A0A7Z9DWG3_9CYAN|nr:CHAT domain-containing protein [Planktothrix paucivesiculata]VXD12364.1 conserved hypothetical protein [Planktothrix paucivesiculata PCC 9631]
MKKILILAANPKNTTPLRLDQELREIQQILRKSNYRDEFSIISVGAVQIDDLQQTLYDHHPTIVHFSGHGSGSDGLVLEDHSGQSVLVREDALARLFKAFQTQIECVILNTCYSEIQANAIHQHIDCVVGMNQAIGDQAAIKFAVGFYRALGAGEPYENCFESGRTLIDLNAIPEVDKPQIKYRNRTKNAAMSSNPESKKTMPSPQENPPSMNKSQSLGNITISGNSGTHYQGFQAFNTVDSEVNLDQSYTQTVGENSKLETALNELQKLKQEIAATNALNSIQKKQAEFPVDMIEAELKKPQPDKSLIDEAVEALKKGLEGVETLAEPVMKVAAILAGVWI